MRPQWPNHVLTAAAIEADFDTSSAHRQRRVAMARRRLLRLSEGNIGDRDQSAFGDITLDDRRADAARAAGDDGDLILQLHRCVFPWTPRPRVASAAGSPPLTGFPAR